MQRTIKVYPNPWGVHPQYLAERKTPRGKPLPVGDVPHSVDRHGRPCHHVLVERTRFAEYVGAKVDAEHTSVDDVSPQLKADYQLFSVPQVTVWSFLGISASDPQFCAKFAKAEPAEVPVTAYYLGALKAGDLLPGDGVAANLAGYKCTPEDFPRLEALALKSAGFCQPNAAASAVAPSQDIPELQDAAGKASGKGKR